MSTLLQQFDLLIVLDERSAKSAADTLYYEPAPFPDASTYFRSNASYEYFLKYCKSVGLRAAFSTTADIIGPGLFRSYWVYTNGWRRILQSAQTSFVFDKFSATDYRNVSTAKVLLSGEEPVRLFHRDVIRDTFDNKLNTFVNFPDHAIPTSQITIHSNESITAAKTDLAEQIVVHPNASDFTDTYILKDQFGSGGANIYLINDDADYVALRTEHPTTSFILQPFIETSQSRFEEHTGRIDLRAILLNGEIVQSFIRIAKAGEYRANAYRGGTLVYIDVDQIPEEVVSKVESIKQRLPIADTVFALDFIQSNSGNYYLVEGNSMPGLNWFVPENAKHARKLMRLIINSIQKELLKSQ